MATEQSKRTTALKYGESSYDDIAYQFINVNPDNGTNTVTIDSSQGQEIVFSIPSGTVHNPSKSYIEFTSTPTAGGSSTFNYQWVNGFPFAQRVQVRLVSGQEFQLNDSLNNKLAVEMPIKTTREQLMKNDQVADGSGCMEGLCVTNGTITSTQPNQFAYHADGVATTKNYTEKKELVVGGSNTATPVIKWRFDLSHFGDFLACDRAVCFNEIVQIVFTTAPIGKCYFKAASATDPTSTPAAGTSIALSGIKLNLAKVEDTYGQATKIRNKMRSSGLYLLLNNTVTSKISLSGSTQNYTYNLQSTNGKKLRSMLVAGFRTETLNNAYLRSNVSQATYTTIRTYTFGEYRQQSVLTISNFDDYKNLKHILNTSCYQSTPEFSHDAFFMDIFHDHTVKDPTKSLGYPLQGNGNDTYMVEIGGVTSTNWHFFACYERRMVINADGIKLG